MQLRRLVTSGLALGVVALGPAAGSVLGRVTGGTGRFKGATGSSTLMATATPTANPQVRNLTLTATGTITLKHKGKKQQRP